MTKTPIKKTEIIKYYTQEDWQRGYESQPNEYDYWIEDIEGEIPLDLKGTFFRNGPGLLDINGQKIAHPFDGDGMISAIAINNGRARYRNRYVQTEGYLAEKKAGKILYRGFGTQKPGGWLANIFDLQPKNVANTNIIYWGGKLLALWEAGQPHSLDPKTLETIGLDDLDGLLEPGQAFSAHPRIEKGKNGKGDVLVNFGVRAGLSSTITIFELDTEGKLLKRHAHTIPGFAFLHDMAITPNYCIFFQNPLTFNSIPFLLGFQGASECLKFSRDLPTKVILIPRNGGEMKVLETETCFVFHHANAWEEEGEIYLESFCYDSFPEIDSKTGFLETDLEALPPSQLWRFKMNLSGETVEPQIVESHPCEFSCVRGDRVGQPYRYLYLGAAAAPKLNAPLQGVTKIDWQTGERQMWSEAPRGFMGDLVFVPRSGGTKEDDGWLLSLMYNAAYHRSELLIFDARDLTSGPVARLKFKHHVPHGFHASFTPELFE